MQHHNSCAFCKLYEVKREARLEGAPIIIKRNKGNIVVEYQKEKYTSTRFLPPIIPPRCTCRNREGELDYDSLRVLIHLLRKKGVTNELSGV